MEKEKLKHINRKVAISVALISTFLAVSKVKDDNVVQAMALAKSDAVDTWNFYQAKKQRDHMAENAITQNLILAKSLGGKATEFVAQVNSRLEADRVRYQQEEKELMDKAKAFEASYDQLNNKDDQFDLSDAFLSVSLMILAVTALTAQDWLLWLSWSLSGFGFLYGLAGFLSWRLHPDWLVRLLS